jgi:fructokinase
MTKRKSPAECPLALGTGLVALDVVVIANEASSPKLYTGGTCGNVLLALRYLGFASSPMCRLHDDTAAAFIIEELRAWGVSTEHVTTGQDGTTPVIVQTIRAEPGEPPTHSFSWRCPYCGARFPGYKPVLAADAEAVAAAMRPAAVFFFDRVSRGAIILATRAAELGAVVVFEPSAVGDQSLFREAWSLAHVVKYSHERLSELPEGFEFSANQILQVETLGSEGLRYRARFRRRAATPWRTLEAIKAPVVRDSAGAGDWCTAGLLHKLARTGAEGLSGVTPEKLEAGLRYGQALAAWNCGYAGARGGMDQVTQEECMDQVERILEGRGAETPKKSAGGKDAEVKQTWCSSCSEVRQPAAESITGSKRAPA